MSGKGKAVPVQLVHGAIWAACKQECGKRGEFTKGNEENEEGWDPRLGQGRRFVLRHCRLKAGLRTQAVRLRGGLGSCEGAKLRFSEVKVWRRTIPSANPRD